MPRPRKQLTAAGAKERHRFAVERDASLLELAILRRDYERLVREERKRNLWLVR